MPMYVVLNEYLSRLSSIEARKPKGERRHVPSLTELAESVGIHRTILSRVANNRQLNLNLDVGSKIISEMRRRGFQMDTTDLVIYREEEAA